jgi:molybdopterin synthase sulfur carrier subunit
LHATQRSPGGQAFGSFKSYLADKTPDSSAIPNEARRNSAKLARPRFVRLASLLCAGYNSSVPSVSQTIRVKALFFGRLKEVIGHAEESLEFPKATTIEQLFAHFAARNPELAKFRSSVVASCNQEFAAWNTPLHSGDEIAFLPPVSGG